MKHGVLAMALTTALAMGRASRAQEPLDGPDAPSARRVFAHYMVCYATYGEGVENYQREMREARAAGIDGFVLNVGAWTKEPHYIRRTRMLYEAAAGLGTEFKLFFSVDLGVVPDILDMLGTYANHPNQFRHLGRVVVSTFSHDSVPWREQVFEPLRQRGIEVFFVPYFYPRPKVTELPDEAAVEAHLRVHADLVDGMFYFGAAGLPQQLADSNRAYARAMRAGGKLFMASYTPHYWGNSQPNRRYYESEGGKGTETQWRAIIESRPEWVEIVTWNDFNESSYVSPLADPRLCLKELLTPYRYCHAGYLELSRYFIQWYKSGKQPQPERDGLFYFYRTHPRAAAPLEPCKPVQALYGDVQDVVFLTTLLSAPGEVVVSSGDRRVVLPAGVGLQHQQTPFACGPQHFELRRNGATVVALDGPPIEAQPAVLDFFPASGFGYGP